MRDPYPTYRELRASAPMYRLERYDAWAVSRFADVWQVIGDTRNFSIHGGPVFVREALFEERVRPLGIARAKDAAHEDLGGLVRAANERGARDEGKAHLAPFLREPREGLGCDEPVDRSVFRRRPQVLP